jgi:hypothetical protein
VNDVDEAQNFRDTALVMHSGGDAPTQQVKGFGNLEKPAVPLKKKPSLVSAMRPRFSSVNNNSSSPLNKESKSTEEKPKKKEVGNEEKENLRRGNKAVENDQKAKGRLSEVGIDAKKNSEKAKGKLRAEVETAEEAAELEERECSSSLSFTQHELTDNITYRFGSSQSTTSKQSFHSKRSISISYCNWNCRSLKDEAQDLDEARTSRRFRSRLGRQ